jgi:transcriptional regulator with XRE-family HTH domain
MSGQEAFAAFLKENGITVTEAAKQLGYSRSFVDLIVKNKTRPNEDRRKEIAAWTNERVPLSAWDSGKKPAIKPFRPARKPALRRAS